MEEPAVNKFPGFSPEVPCMFLRRSATSCELARERECEKLLISMRIGGGRCRDGTYDLSRVKGEPETFHNGRYQRAC